jgi:hypothetical protein
MSGRVGRYPILVLYKGGSVGAISCIFSIVGIDVSNY